MQKSPKYSILLMCDLSLLFLIHWKLYIPKHCCDWIPLFLSVVFLLFSSKYLISILISSLINGLLRSKLPIFSAFGNFADKKVNLFYWFLVKFHYHHIKNILYTISIYILLWNVFTVYGLPGWRVNMHLKEMCYL